MPPRRSSRAPSVSAEVPLDAPPAPKRKRGSAAAVEAEEATVKPPSRARRSASARPTPAPASNVKKTTRSKASLPDVPESDNEEQSDAPPPKKARPSIETVEQDSGDELAPAPTRARRTTKTAGGSKQVAAMDVDEDVKPAKPPSRRTSTRKSVASTVSAASSSAGAVEEDEESSSAKGKRTATRGKRGPSKLKEVIKEEVVEEEPIPEVDENVEEAEVEEEEEIVKPARKGRKGSAVPTSKGKAATKRETKKVTIEESGEESEAPPSAQVKEPTPEDKEVTPPTAPANEVQDEDDEPENLFEPVPMPAPSSLPQNMPEEPAGPKHRLVIHKMALVNFKSYAGRQEIGPFHKSFSAIVGPNGSGKSNTIDALLFVFGYRATKMRQGKLSELIHNSADHPDLQECRVEVHFRDIIDLPGSNAFEVVPNSQLVVTRKAYRDNSSKYTINGRNSSYKEVQALLKGRGIDLDHNRFLILQGEVESIAQMKPKASNEHEEGLLEYLEDIIGTSKYKEPIDEAMVEMERIQEERQIKMNRLRLVEKEKEALEERKKDAEKFLRLKNDAVRAVSLQYQWVIWKALEHEDTLTARVDKLKAELRKETERNKDDISLFDELQQHYKQREQDYIDVQAAAEEANKELASSERAEIGLQERRKHAATRSKKLKKSLQDDGAALKTAKNTIEDSSSKMKREKSKLEQLEADLEDEEAELEKIRDSLKDKTQAFHDEIQLKQRELAPWTGKINAKQAEIDVARSERDALAKKAEDLRKQTKEAQEILNNLREELKEKSGEQAEIKTEAQRTARELQGAERKVQDAQAAVQEWRGKATGARNKVDEARANQSENRSRNNVLDSLTRLRDAGQLEGFHGRLGSLGTIPEKYDVAISTAAGGPLNNMVVDKVSQAQQCIDYLRKNNVGRASFMVLEKLSSQGMQKINAPLPRLFDLIKPKDQAFAPAFYKAMYNTLVADTVDQANNVAFGQADGRRWRVVSLDGAVIETSGAMSGGGGQPQRGAMSSKLAANAVSPQVLQTFEKDSEHAAQQLQKATNELRIAESELESLRRRGPELDLAFQKIGMEIDNIKRRIAEAERRVKDLGNNDKPNKAELARISVLDGEIESGERDLEKIQQKTQKIEVEIKALEKKILDVGGARLLTQKSKVDGMRLHINLANDEITKAEVSKAKAEKDIIKLENNIANNEGAYEEAKTDLESLEEQVNTLVAYVTDLKNKVEAAQIAVENSKEDLESIKSELDEQEAKISQFKKKEMAIKQEVQDAEKEWKDNSSAIEHYQQLHDDLRLEDVDEDDDEEDDDEGEGGEQKPPVEQEESEPPVKKEGGEKAEKAAKPEGLPMYSADQLRKFRKEELFANSAYLEEKIKNAKPDLSVLKEYKKREAEFEERADAFNKITAERDQQKAKYDGLRKQRLDEFMSGFNLISMKLKEMYQMITLGGNAELELVDSLDPFSEGIIFSVMPPKKSWKNISNLSGGEKTLSSLALVFALHVFKPTPLYFMDEIDAALDFRNVSIVANYIKDRTKNAQFIIISLRNDMFELAHRLIGIYKTSNQTRSLSIDNHSLQGSIIQVPKPTQKQQQQQQQSQNESTKGPLLSAAVTNRNASFATPSAMS